MGLLDSLFGGQQQQQDYQGFVNRYMQGAPSEGYSDQEVLQRYQQVAPQLNPQQYQQAAMQAFERMPPQERMALGQMLMQSASQQGVNFSNMGNGSYQDPAYLAQMTTQAHQQSPGILGQLLGGGGGGGGNAIGGALSNPLAKAALAGIVAMAAKNFLGGRALP